MPRALAAEIRGGGGFPHPLGHPGMESIRARVVLDLERLKHVNCGVGRFCLDLARALLDPRRRRTADQVIDPVLFAPPEATAHLEPLVSALRVRRMSVSSFRKESIVRWLRPLVRPFLPAPRIDVWHTTHQLSKYMPVDPRVPVVLTIHDLNFLHDAEHAGDPARIERKLAGIQNKIDRASAITTVSRFTADDVRSHLDVADKPIHVIPNGLSSPPSASTVRPRFLPPGRFLLTVGNCVPHKNFHVLLGLISRLPDRRLVIAGKKATPYGGHLEREIVRQGLQDRVIMPGEVSDGDRQWLYENCEAFLFPSLAEGFGFPVLEAMQAGKPVFCSRRTSLPEVVGEDAFYFDSFESDAMFDVCRRGLEESRVAIDFSSRLKNRAARYSWEASAQGYARVYGQLVGS